MERGGLGAWSALRPRQNFVLPVTVDTTITLSSVNGPSFPQIRSSGTLIGTKLPDQDRGLRIACWSVMARTWMLEIGHCVYASGTRA